MPPLIVKEDITMEKASVDEWKETFIHNVIWLRKFYGISKKRMAQLLGIGVQSLNRIESGEIPPKIRIDIFINILWLAVY